MRLPLSSVYPALIALAAQGACVDPTDVPSKDDVVSVDTETDLPTHETDSVRDTSSGIDSNLIPTDTDEDPDFLRRTFGNLIVWGTQNPEPIASAPIDLLTGVADSEWVRVTGQVHRFFNASMEARLFTPQKTLQKIVDLESGVIVFHVNGAFWIIQKPELLSMQEIMSFPIGGTNDMADLSETNVYLELQYSDGVLVPNDFGLSPSMYEANTTEYVDQFVFSNKEGAVAQNGDIFDEVAISRWADPSLNRLIKADDVDYDISTTRATMDAVIAEAPVHEADFGTWYLMGQSADPAVNKGVKSWTAPFSGVPAVYLPPQ